MVLSRIVRRPVSAALAGLLMVSATAVLTAPPAAALSRPTIMHNAAVWVSHRPYTIGIAVLDTRTGQFYGAGAYRATFASESVVKVFIAARLLVSGRMTGSIRARAYKMITQSDDAIASSLYGMVGGDGLITWVKRHYHEPDLGSPPRRRNWWGNTHIRPDGLVRLYAKLERDPRVGPWLLHAMHHATRYGSDGTYQFFGIASATRGAAIKQGWGADYDDWWHSADFNTTGFVNGDRYAIAILARGPSWTYGGPISSMLTAAARMLLPQGAFPAPSPQVTGLSVRRGSTAGGTTVIVSGTDLTRLRAVLFGGVRARSVTALSPSRLRVIAPPHTTGTVAVEIRTDHGYSPDGPADRFAYLAPPAVARLSATSGPTAGGNTVTVTGSGFTDVTRVRFGDRSATAVRVQSATTLQVRVPAHAAGAVHVTVTTPYGTSPSTAADTYTYVAPPPSSGARRPHRGTTGRHRRG